MPDINVMENIHKDIEACGRCDCKKLQVNSKMVMNGGNLNAALFFVGIAPSFYNHTEFVFEVENYPTNRIFHEGLKRIGLTRYDVYITNAVKLLQDNGTVVSLFIDPEKDQITAAAETGAKFIELHTGNFANAETEALQFSELDKLIHAAEFAHGAGLRVNAGHGLNYINVTLMHDIPHLEELNIGHSIIARSVFTGLEMAVRDMKSLIT